MGKGLKQIDKIQKQLVEVGLQVERDDDEKNPCLYVKRKPTSKKSMFELVFNKKGKLINLVAGPKQTKAAWIEI